MTPPRVRTDLVEVTVFRVRAGVPEFLLLRRAAPPLEGTWHPVMGHARAGETLLAAALRELHEETGLRVPSPACLGVWSLQGVHPYYLPSADAVVLSPRLAARVTPDFTPTLSAEHTEFAWIDEPRIDAAVLWPGQRLACREVIDVLLPQHSPQREHLRLA
jgi:8-oxo-dGTP pyrophosphatase MutT (NUDIX family)